MLPCVNTCAMHSVMQSSYAIQFCRREPRWPQGEDGSQRKPKARAWKARSRPLYCCNSTCSRLNAEGQSNDISRIMWNSQLESEIGEQHEGFKLSTDDLQVFDEREFKFLRQILNCLKSKASIYVIGKKCNQILLIVFIDSKLLSHEIASTATKRFQKL